MLDFGALPPEINSSRMHAGPGSGPMYAAAAAWDGLAAELGSVAAGYASAITDLTSLLWLGPASVAMAASMTPYVAWLSGVAAQAEQAGTQARAAAAAYETAFAMTVPPPAITANRRMFMRLVATNFFGQNTPAIAATEAGYSEMWAQDAAAMYCYAECSAAAAALTPFRAPPQLSRFVWPYPQGAAIAKTAAELATTSACTLSQVSELSSAAKVPQLLQQLSSSGSAISLNPNDWWIVKLLGSLTGPERTTIVHTLGLSYFETGVTQSATSIAQQLTFGPGQVAASLGRPSYPTPRFASPGGLGGDRITVSATSAESTKIGKLSVPPRWAVPQAGLDCPTPGTVGPGVTDDVPASTGSPAALLRRMPPMGASGHAAAGNTNRYGFRFDVLARPPSAG